MPNIDVFAHRKPPSIVRIFSAGVENPQEVCENYNALTSYRTTATQAGSTVLRYQIKAFLK